MPSAPRCLPVTSALFVGTLALMAVAHPAHAQRQGFEGMAGRRHDQTQEEKLLDLNGDGKVDDYERELAFTNLRQQAGMDENGEINKEGRRVLLAKRKQLQAEARAREKAEAAAEKLREKKAKGRTLTDAEEGQLRAADAAAESRQRERERQAREAAKAPASHAAQMLAKPIIDAGR